MNVMNARSTTLQQTIIEQLGVKPSIDAAAEIDARVDFLADYPVSYTHLTLPTKA